MKIVHQINNELQLVKIMFYGHAREESAHKIIQRAMVKVFGGDFQEVVLDLRKVIFEKSSSTFRLHSLVEVFKSVLLQKELQVTIMFDLEDGARWMFFEKVAKFDGITMRYFTNRKAALLGARLFAVQPKTCPALNPKRGASRNNLF